MEIKEAYEQYFNTVFGYLCALTGGNYDLAEELTQETFFRATKKISEFRGECKMSTWLCQIAKHLLYQTYAKAGRQVIMEQDETKPAKENTEQTVLNRIELIDCLKELQKLPEQMREVVYLRVMSDLSYREIGEIMGKSENWARVNFYRAKELLLKGCGRDE